MSKKNDDIVMKATAVGAVLALPVAAIATSSTGSIYLAYFVWWAVISGVAYFLLNEIQGGKDE